MAAPSRRHFVLSPFEKVQMDEEGKTRRVRVPPELLEGGEPSAEHWPSGVRRSPNAAGTASQASPQAHLHEREAALSSAPPAMPPRRSVPPPLPPAATAGRIASSPVQEALPDFPSVSLADIGQVLRAFQEQLGIVAVQLFKQEILRRHCLPSTLPMGQLASFVEQLVVHLDTPEARNRFRRSLAPLVRADLLSRMARDPSEKGR
jgi:hypothetical protein